MYCPTAFVVRMFMPIWFRIQRLRTIRGRIVWSYHMDDWPPSLIVTIILLGLIGVFATVFYGAVSDGYSALSAGCAGSLGAVFYIGVVLYALRDWWEG